MTRPTRNFFPGMQSVWNIKNNSPSTPDPPPPPPIVSSTAVINLNNNNTNFRPIIPRNEEPIEESQPSSSNPPQPNTPIESEPSTGNGYLHWNSRAIDELLTVMELHYNRIREETDQRVITSVWEEVCAELKARALNIDSTTDPKFDTTSFIRLLNVDKVRRKWNALKRTYTTIRDTPGNQSTQVNVEHNNKVGQILRNDEPSNINPEIDDDDSSEDSFENAQNEQRDVGDVVEEGTSRTPATVTARGTSSISTSAEIARLRRRLASASAEIDNISRLEQDKLFDRINRMLNRQSTKRKADLDSAVAAILAEKEQDREEKRQRHNEQQAVLSRIAEGVETMARRQMIMLQLMGYNDDQEITDPNTSVINENSSKDKHPTQDQ